MNCESRTTNQGTGFEANAQCFVSRFRPHVARHRPAWTDQRKNQCFRRRSRRPAHRHHCCAVILSVFFYFVDRRRDEPVGDSAAVAPRFTGSRLDWKYRFTSFSLRDHIDSDSGLSDGLMFYLTINVRCKIFILHS